MQIVVIADNLGGGNRIWVTLKHDIDSPNTFMVALHLGDVAAALQLTNLYRYGDGDTLNDINFCSLN